MNVAFLCLGGNIGNRIENMTAAKKAIEADLGKINKLSGIYETAAWGSTSKNQYLNQVIEIETQLNATNLLKGLLAIEKKLGRKRGLTKNGDRTIDIDILFFNSEVHTTKNMEIPHPRLQERNFVLKPLSEIAGNLKHPLLKKTINQLLKLSKDKLAVKPFNPAKAIRYICIEGNIGSGKSTLAKALAKKMNATFLPEEFEDNLLLPLFYENKKLFAFPLEYSFLLARFNQMQRAFKHEKKIIISDYSIYKCLWFAKINLTAKDYALFKEQFKIMLAQLPKPDMLIHLSSNTKNLKQNIKKRGRKYEQGISEDYLNAISAQFEKGIQKLKNINTLNLPVSTYHSKLEEASIQTINNFIKESFGG